ncbi:odorant receptor 4-like [Osmia bicornis bicornis]|uniref:odorant receptor 4-like n=1 Tax=Osmia bicornis bicornis TaxID=1437191 RepID=UPI001EAEEFB4|nr:odorant receptor 4-like [Osmia bicornis bicornis]
METVYVSLRSFIIITCDKNEERADHLTIFPGYFPYDIRRTSFCIFTNLGQAITGYIAAITYTSIDSFIGMLVIHICGQFEILKMKLERLMGDEDCGRDAKQIQKELAWIVKRHEDLSHSAAKIEECFNMLLLMQMLLCTIEICFQGFILFNVVLKDVSGLLSGQMLFFMLSVPFILVHIYIYCYIGEKLLVQNREMSNSAYKSNWFNVAPSESKCLLFIMQRSHRPLCLTAGKFSTFSIELFSTILKTSMGYLSVLLTVFCILDLKYVYSWNQYTMKFIGIWPEERKWNRPSSYLVLIAVLMMLCFITIPQTINLTLIWGDMDLVVENLSMGNITITISLLKTIAFWTNGKSLKSLLECMAKDWSTPVLKNEYESMKKIGKISRTIIMRSTIMCNTVAIAYGVLRMYSMKYTENKLFFRAYFPYDVDSTPNYQLTMFAQFLGTMYAAITYTCVDTFVAMLILHICGQLSNLKEEIKKLSVQSEKDFQANLGKIVRKHQYLNRFAGQVENCFNMMLLVQMLGCTVQLCFQCFQAIMSFGVEVEEYLILQISFLIIYVIYVMLHLYLYCYVGERLTAEGLEIANAVYDSEWYNLSAKNTKLLILIICRAKTPLQITAGRFCSFTLELYFQILKTSMGYISVLCAMKN